jgi:hypothetical protein
MQNAELSILRYIIQRNRLKFFIPIRDDEGIVPYGMASTFYPKFCIRNDIYFLSEILHSALNNYPKKWSMSNKIAIPNSSTIPTK